MFHYKKLCNIVPQVNNARKLCVNTKQKWNLFTSVCLERKPVVSQLLNEIEKEFSKYLSQIELERSLLSDHEIRNLNDKKKEILLKNAGKEDNIDVDATLVQTAQDFEDACNEELNKFSFASRKTDADKNNDLKSLQRKLDKHLMLLVQQKIGNNSYYLPPQTKRNEGETLKQSAERILGEMCGNSLKAQIYGNAPIGFYKYKYPKELQGAVGAKVFIYFARYLKGDIKDSSEYKWLDRKEMKAELPEEYYKCLTRFLVDEHHT